MKKIGIDIGGTNTDFIFQNEKEIHVFKIPSTPDDPGKAATAGIKAIAEQFELKPDEIDFIAHGTTVSTNAVIERKGAKTSLITTKGFKDLLEIARLSRPPEALYDIQYEKPEQIVARFLRFEIDERVDFKGEVIRQLPENELVSLIERIKQEDLDAIAVTFLFSYLYPAHEREVQALIKKELPDLYVTISSEILPEFREYERTAATVLNAYLGPVINRYLQKMQDDIREQGLAGQFYIMQSNGGLTTPSVCMKKPITTILSGPAAGVVSASSLTQLAGFENAISIDMGGTSFDVSLIWNRQPLLSTTKKILDYPLVIPMIDIQTIGAGGGSIAWLDPGDSLRVGPQSAGAVPGPACYGLGGEDPTVTDADMVLGFLNPQFLLGGKIEISIDRAHRAIERKIADKLKLDPVEAAEGIYRIVNAKMSGATRVISIEKGYDPREFALIAFGGAGPVHAAEIARELEIPWTIIPRYPGVTSALGLIIADIIHDYTQTFTRKTESINLNQLIRAYKHLEKVGNEDLAKDGITLEDRIFIRSADMRYAGQVYALNVEFSEREINDDVIEQMIQQFHKQHKWIYGFNVEGEPVEIVNLRIRAIGRLEKFESRRSERLSSDDGEALKGERRVYFPEAGFTETPVYDRQRLMPGDKYTGPAIIEQIDSTIVIPPGFIGTVDQNLNMIIGKEEWRYAG
ncbi:hydantoinase/oxoprolinase family protein [Thermodesulfobacteriota bacterium]